MNTTENFDLTIIVPVYNEEDNIDALNKKLCNYISIASCKTCVLFINDGSKDNSKKGIKKICDKNNSFFYATFEKNAGLSTAIKAGIDIAQSKYIGYIDADLQTDPDEFNELLKYAKEYPLVMGIRANRKDSAFKKFQSKVANGFRRKMTNDGASDTGCPLKIMQSNYAKRIPFFNGMHRFLPALVILQDGGKYKEIPVHHFPRTAGVSKYNIWNRLIGPFKDCFAYRWMKKRYINYHITDNNIDIRGYRG